MFAQKYRKQLYGTLCANIICIAYGTVCGWPSASFPELIAADSDLLPSGPLNMDELSWVGSFMCIGAIFGNSYFSWASDRFGRKNALIQSAMPCLLGWCLLLFAQNAYWLYVARFLLGFSGAGAFVVIPLFVSEIAEKEVRGSLGSLMIFSNNFGILISFIAGHYMPYSIRPVFFLIFPVIFMALFVMFPETPAFLAQNGRSEEADQALRFYRNVGAEDSDAGTALKSELEELNKRNHGADEKAAVVRESIAWSDFTTRHGRRASLIGIVLISGSQFCGSFAMLNYTADIFAKTGLTMSSNVAAIVMGVVQLLGAYVAILLVDRAGRKFLLAASALGSALGLIQMGVFMHFQDAGYDLHAYGLIPMFGFALLVFAANYGLMTLPFLVISELMPERVRSIGTSLCMTLLYTLGFVLLKGFPMLVQVAGMPGAMFVFAACSLVSAVFVIGWLPETCGKSFEAIRRMMEN